MFETWNEVLAKVRELTKKRGYKAGLAHFAGVRPPRVSEWLRENKSDENKKATPTGEQMLKILNWVENPQRKPKQNAHAPRKRSVDKRPNRGNPYHEKSRSGRKRR